MLPLLADPLFSPLLVSKPCPGNFIKSLCVIKILKTKHEGQLHVFLHWLNGTLNSCDFTLLY